MHLVKQCSNSLAYVKNIQAGLPTAYLSISKKARKIKKAIYFSFNLCNGLCLILILFKMRYSSLL